MNQNVTENLIVFIVGVVVGVLSYKYLLAHNRHNRDLIEKSEKNESEILKLLSDNKLTHEEVREKLNLKDNTIERLLAKLLKENKIERVSGGRYAYYVKK